MPDNGFAAFETIVQGSGSVTFWWKSSSEANDYLRFLVDGVQVSAISGTKTPWTWVSNRVEGAYAEHTLRWEYAKNASLTSTSDAAWVDDIVWIGDVPMPVVAPDIHSTTANDSGFKFTFWGERGIPYTVFWKQKLSDLQWEPLDIRPVEIGSDNGLFEFEAIVTLPEDRETGFFRVKGEGGEGKEGKYLIVDLAGGPNASSYPIMYTDSIPAGGWTDEFKTTKLVLRRIPAGVFTMGSPAGEVGRESNETQHGVTLTPPFYIGVFEVTQRQWDLVMGSNPSYYKGNARPVEKVSYNMIRGSSAGSGWPANNNVDASSFIGKIRAKAGLPGSDLPTEAQWEYACRAGTTTALNSGKNLTSTSQDANMAEVGRYIYNLSDGKGGYNDAHTTVGSYMPNAWGLYDMHGNVLEWCLDWSGSYPSGSVVDPRGAATGSERVRRGGGLLDIARSCRSADMNSYPPNNNSDYNGFRIAMTPTIIPSGMVLIPAGTNSGTDPDSGTYSLTVNAFYMDATEVTKAKWDEVYTWAIANGYGFDNSGSGKAANHPVQTVSWYDVVKWCNARSQKEGRPAVYTVGGAVYKTGRSDDVVQTSAAGYRLPKEVEWEYAARGGLSGKRFPWGDTIQHARANYSSSSSYSYDTSPTRGYHPDYDNAPLPYTSPVGSFAPNGYGLYDMSGNLWEWCFEWHPSYGQYRINRGGAWETQANISRSGFRGYYPPANAVNFVGFRAVLPVQ